FCIVATPSWDACRHVDWRRGDREGLGPDSGTHGRVGFTDCHARAPNAHPRFAGCNSPANGFALAIALYTLAVGAQGADARQRGAMTLVLEKVGGSRRTSTTILVRRPYAGVEALKRRHRGFRHRQLRTLSKTNNTFGAEWSRRLRN